MNQDNGKLASLPEAFRLIPKLLADPVPHRLYLRTWQDFGGPDSPSRAGGTQRPKIMSKAIRLLLEEVRSGSDETRRQTIVCLLRILQNGYGMKPESLPFSLHNHWSQTLHKYEPHS